VLGSRNVMEAAVARKVAKVVLLSTDKAVYPINAMGLSKALMEKFMLVKARNLKKGETVLCATRYGNLMGSRGSVIPLFIDQVRRGAPLTVTDPEMTRFLMSLEESVDLVLHAFREGKNGDIFVQKAPAATMADLAEAVRKIFRVTNSTKIIGTRHGEKLFETLVSREEMTRARETTDHFCVPADDRDLDYANYFTKGEKKISAQEDYTSQSTRRLGIPAICQLLKSQSFIRKALNA